MQDLNWVFKQISQNPNPPVCLYCGEREWPSHPHTACSEEVDTIQAPEGAALGDYVWFHQRALEAGYNMAVMPPPE